MGVRKKTAYPSPSHISWNAKELILHSSVVQGGIVLTPYEDTDRPEYLLGMQGRCHFLRQYSCPPQKKDQGRSNMINQATSTLSYL